MRAGEIIALDSPAALKQATFPHGVYELTPRAALRSELVTRLQQPQAGFAMQPYGRRYHALVHDPAAWRAAQTWIDADFTVRAVSPSLEDVFIERVEGQGR
jgi:hypothetical protein